MNVILNSLCTEIKKNIIIDIHPERCFYKSIFLIGDHVIDFIELRRFDESSRAGDYGVGETGERFGD